MIKWSEQSYGSEQLACAKFKMFFIKCDKTKYRKSRTQQFPKNKGVCIHKVCPLNFWIVVCGDRELSIYFKLNLKSHDLEFIYFKGWRVGSAVKRLALLSEDWSSSVLQPSHQQLTTASNSRSKGLDTSGLCRHCTGGTHSHLHINKNYF